MNYKHFLACIFIIALGIVINHRINQDVTGFLIPKVILAEEGEGDGPYIIEPSAICSKLRRVYNSSVGRDTEGNSTASCSETRNADIVNVITSEEKDFSALKPHLILNNGLKVYFETSNLQQQPELSGGSASDEDKNALRIFIDIDGDTGNSILWEDVFPFYITESGKVIPARNTARRGIAALSNRYLSFNTAYDDYSDGTRRVKIVPGGANLSFVRAACITGYVRSSNYCTINGSLISPADVCLNSNGTIKDEADCRLRIKKPWNIN